MTNLKQKYACLECGETFSYKHNYNLHECNINKVKQERMFKSLKRVEQQIKQRKRFVYIKIKKINYKCANCHDDEVEHRGDWCDTCNLPERSSIQ